MGILSCANCSKDAASLLDWGNPIFMFNPDKKCRNCKIPIELNKNLFFGLCIFGIFYSFLSVVVSVYLANIFFREDVELYTNIGIVFLYLIALLLFNLIAKIYNLRYFNVK